jgi:hypothetical protein
LPDLPNNYVSANCIRPRRRWACFLSTFQLPKHYQSQHTARQPC